MKYSIYLVIGSNPVDLKDICNLQEKFGSLSCTIGYSTFINRFKMKAGSKIIVQATATNDYGESPPSPRSNSNVFVQTSPQQMGQVDINFEEESKYDHLNIFEWQPLQPNSL